MEKEKSKNTSIILNKTEIRPEDILLIDADIDAGKKLLLAFCGDQDEASIYLAQVKTEIKDRFFLSE